MNFGKRSKLLLLVSAAGVFLLGAIVVISLSQKPRTEKIQVGMTPEEIATALNEPGFGHILQGPRFVEIRESSSNLYPGSIYSMEFDTDNQRLKALSVTHPTKMEVFKHWILMLRIQLGI